MARVWFGAGQGGSGQQGVDPRACCLVRCCCPLCWVLSVPLHPSCLPPTPELEAPPWPFLSLLNPWVTYLLRKSHSDLRPQTCPIRVLPRGTQLRALGAAGGLCWPGLCPGPSLQAAGRDWEWLQLPVRCRARPPPVLGVEPSGHSRWGQWRPWAWGHGRWSPSLSVLGLCATGVSLPTWSWPVGLQAAHAGSAGKASGGLAAPGPGPEARAGPVRSPSL